MRRRIDLSKKVETKTTIKRTTTATTRTHIYQYPIYSEGEIQETYSEVSQENETPDEYDETFEPEESDYEPQTEPELQENPLNNNEDKSRRPQEIKDDIDKAKKTTKSPKQANGEAAKQATTEVTKQATEEAAKKATEEAAKKAAEEAAKKAAAKTATKAAASEATAAAAAAGIEVILIVLLVIAIIIAIIIIVALIIGLIEANRTSFGNYYSLRCNEITVINVDDNYNPVSTETYDVEDYVAGVVANEIGAFNNKEIFKVYAIGARTYGQLVADDDCTIENSARTQTFKDITNSTNPTHQLIYEAVEETKGIVALDSAGNLYTTEYDAFCYTEKDSQYYTLSQQSQKIPIDWAESNITNYGYLNCPCEEQDQSKLTCWSNKGEWLDGGHGRGMSQYGALYLIEEKEYTYDEVLKYYYGDEITLSSQFMTSIAGLEVKNTTSAKPLNEPLGEFLQSNGSSIEDMNNFIHENVEENGVGTREGVVTAAVSLINYLFDNFNTKLPYYWGGAYQYVGVSSSFGSYAPSTASRSGKIYYYKSFDCSGFVSWAIKNGGYNLGRTTSYAFDAYFSDNSCDIEDSSCIGQPGDLINAPNDHVQLIIAVDKEAKKYIIADSGSDGVVMKERDMHKDNSIKGNYKIIHMDSYYNNAANVNPDY